MADRPIIFSAPMVRALLDGRKAQTRRILKPQPPDWAAFCQQPSMLNVKGEWVASGLWRWSESEQTPLRPLREWPVDESGEHFWYRPKMVTGDRLWVREAHAILRSSNGEETEVVYRAHEDGPFAWKPSIHMPRWASRLTLIVTGVKVERLQDISDEDARAEGMVRRQDGWFAVVDEKRGLTGAAPDARAAFGLLWNMINGPEAWDANPWVVALSFTVHRRNIDTLDKAA